MHDSDALKSFIKSPYKSYKHSTYFYVYDHLFSQYKNKEITFVEVGVYGGGSLFMWRDFFGDKARIIGIDLNPEAKKFEEFGFEIYIGSQKDEIFWKNFKKDVGIVDIVLDDGGHTYEQQITTTESLVDNIRDGGLLVVEDTHTSYIDGFGIKKYSFIEYVKKIIDKINYRFGPFGKKNSENRIWSVEIYESIVVFRINRKATSLKSGAVNNNGKLLYDLNDFRHSDQKEINTKKYFK